MSREITRIGVVGWAPWVPASWRSSPAAATTSSASRSTRQALERGRGHVEGSTARAVKRGKLTEEERAETHPARIRLHDDSPTSPTATSSSRRCRSSLDLKRTIFAAARQGLRARTPSSRRNTSSLSVTEIAVATARPAQVVGMHFFNPAPVQAFVEMVQHRRHRRPTSSTTSQARRAEPRQAAGRRRRQGRVHRQRAAVRLPQPRRVDVRDEVRVARGHRRRDEARLRPADGPARAARPHRPRHGVRDPRHDVQAGSRPPARAVAGAQADGHRGPARPQERSRLLHLRGAELPGRRRPTRSPRRWPTPARCRRRPVQLVGVVGSGTMAVGIIEVFAKAGFDVRYVARGDDKVAKVRSSLERSLDKGVARGKLDRGRPRRRPRPRHRHDQLDDLADGDLVVEAVVEDLARQDRAVRVARRDLQAGRDHRDHDVEPAGRRRRRRDEVPGRTSSVCTSSTRLR